MRPHICLSLIKSTKGDSLCPTLKYVRNPQADTILASDVAKSFNLKEILHHGWIVDQSAAPSGFFLLCASLYRAGPFLYCTALCTVQWHIGRHALLELKLYVCTSGLRICNGKDPAAQVLRRVGLFIHVQPLSVRSSISVLLRPWLLPRSTAKSRSNMNRLYAAQDAVWYSTGAVRVTSVVRFHPHFRAVLCKCEVSG